MLSFTTHHYGFFSRKEIWFYNGEPVAEASYNMFSAAKKVIGPNVIDLQRYMTTVIDLSRTKEELFNSIQERIRRYIRAAEKQGLEVTQSLEPSASEKKEAVRIF